MRKIVALVGLALMLSLIFGCVPAQEDQTADIQEPTEDIPSESTESMEELPPLPEELADEANADAEGE